MKKVIKQFWIEEKDVKVILKAAEIQSLSFSAFIRSNSLAAARKVNREAAKS